MDKEIEISNELWAAYELIPKGVIQSPDGFDESYFLECMKKKQFLHAMEELDGIIEDNKSPSKKFWLHLIEAAKLMNHSHVERYRSILKATR